MTWSLSNLLGNLLRGSRSAKRRGSGRGRRRVRLEAEPLEPRWLPSLTTLVAFNGTDGSHPTSGLIVNGSHLEGTTYNGGANNAGEVFEIILAGGIAFFSAAPLSSSLGEDPTGNLIEDGNGDFFGTASKGGSSNDGTVFELTNFGKLTDLANFSGSFSKPWGVVEDSGGNLFGVTTLGGAHDDGAVYEVKKGSGTITTLASLDGANTGYAPTGSLVIDSSGNLFGVAQEGGPGPFVIGYPGYGTAFKVQSGTIGEIGTFFAHNPDHPQDGVFPNAGLVEDSSGNFLGTTLYDDQPAASGDGGTVFKLNAADGGNTAAITTLGYFNGLNGTSPNGVIEDSSGNLFGTTSSGGAFNDGTVFELPADAASAGFFFPPIVTLASFNGSNGATPECTLAEDASGNLFGTTSEGGSSNDGTVFELQPPQITTPSLANWTMGLPGYSQTISAINGTGAFTYSVLELNSQPPGLTLSSTGVLSGTPTQAGTYHFTVMATDSAGDNPYQVYDVTINPPVTVLTAALPNSTAGTAFNQTIGTSGGTGTLTVTATGTLPPGLTLSSGGVLSGTPTTAGIYTFPVTATDTLGASASQSYTVTINPGPFTHYLVTTLSGSASVTAGSPFLVVVQAVDNFNNPITLGYSGPSTVTVQTSPTSSTFPATVAIGSIGQGLFLANLPTVGTYTLTASGGTFTSNAVAVTVTPAPAAKLAFAAQPVATPTGDVLPTVSVKVEDAYGNVITSDNTDTVTVGIASGPPGAPGFTTGSTTTATVHNGVATFNSLTLITPGAYSLSESVPGLYAGPNSLSFAVVPLQVVPGSLAGSPSGFSFQFNTAFLVNSTTPVLYGQGFGATAPVPSITLTQTKDASGNPVNNPIVGSLVLNTTADSTTFVATNTSLEVNNGSPILPDGTYTVVVHSSAATDGFQALNPGGGFLDGLDTGVPGSGDFKGTFTVNAAATKQPVVWVPATADGPGQQLNAPGNNQVGGGYPVYLDSAGGVTGVLVTLNYNPALLTVTGVTGTGFSLLGTSTAGQAVLQYSGAALPAGTQTALGFLTASVPPGTTSTPTPYRAKDLLHLSGISVNGTALVLGGDALHLVAYVGDADGNGTYSSNDAVLITRAALQIDSGFTAYPLVDPVIVADTDGSGFIPADAALQVNEAGVGFPTSNLPSPPIPPGVHFQAIADTLYTPHRAAANVFAPQAQAAPSAPGLRRTTAPAPQRTVVWHQFPDATVAAIEEYLRRVHLSPNP